MDTKDQVAEVLINHFMNALLSGDFEESSLAVIPYVHVSLLDRNKNTLSRDLLDFSFKKAHSNAKNYSVPVKITRVAENKITGIGYGDTAETGSERKYWIDKKSDSPGMPAPLNVFFPTDGAEPSMSYMGSL